MRKSAPKAAKSLPVAGTIRQIAVADLKRYPQNARTHSKEQVQQIAASIQEFGFTNPVLARADLTLIAGHGRLAAAEELGLEEVPVIILDHLSETQARALVIADNKIALNAGWDLEVLAGEIADLRDLDFDLDLLAFDDDELRVLFEDTNSPPATPPAATAGAAERQQKQCPACGHTW